MNPYLETIPTENVSLRIFNQSVSEEELVWHRDQEDRIVTALHPTDWQIQLENELPSPLTEVFVSKGLYHRVIKGTGNLHIRINKL